MRIFNTGALFFVWIYRRLVSPWLKMNCRFLPTCSAYADQALREHRFDHAAILITKRLCKCHPWGPSGLDPVPPKKVK